MKDLNRGNNKANLSSAVPPAQSILCGWLEAGSWLCPIHNKNSCSVFMQEQNIFLLSIWQRERTLTNTIYWLFSEWVSLQGFAAEPTLHDSISWKSINHWRLTVCKHSFSVGKSSGFCKSIGCFISLHHFCSRGTDSSHFSDNGLQSSDLMIPWIHQAQNNILSYDNNPLLPKPHYRAWHKSLCWNNVWAVHKLQQKENLQSIIFVCGWPGLGVSDWAITNMNSVALVPVISCECVIRSWTSEWAPAQEI